MLDRRRVMAGLAWAATAETAAGADRPIGPAWTGRSAVYAPKAAAATSHPLATQIALDQMRAGGSAVDAAIAANAALGVVEPTGCGMGGDLFALVWDPVAGRLLGLNASGPAPKGQSYAQLRRRVGDRATIPASGARCATVPGAVDGWLELHKKWGKRPLTEVLAPAARYAREGHPVSPIVAWGWAANLARFARERNDIEEFDTFTRLWTFGGAAPKAGDVYQNPVLADTLEAVAAEGRAWFYEGEGARRLDATMRRIGGPLRQQDLAAYRAEWAEPISTRYRDVDVWQMPPNGQGVTVLQMLNILEGFDLKGMGFGTPEAVHVMAEAKKLAFADRARFIADPRMADVPTARMLDKAYAAELRARIRLDAAAPAPATSPLEGGDTIYLCTADARGLMVSLIQSNYRGMGSGITPEGLGFTLQNRGAQFSLDPKSRNAYAPGKRPFHTIIPGFATRAGAPWMAFGVMGGAMQPQGHTQAIVNMVDFGMDPQEAGDAPRWRHIGGPDPDGGGGGEEGDLLHLESGYSPELRAKLETLGHRLARGYQDVGGYQAIQRVPGGYRAGSDQRKDGQAGGF